MTMWCNVSQHGEGATQAETAVQESSRLGVSQANGPPKRFCKAAIEKMPWMSSWDGPRVRRQGGGYEGAFACAKQAVPCKSGSRPIKKKRYGKETQMNVSDRWFPRCTRSAPSSCNIL
jgi:hypothetical protein